MNGTQGYYLAVLGMLIAYFGLGWSLAGVVVGGLDVWDIMGTAIACLWGYMFYVIGRDAVNDAYQKHLKEICDRYETNNITAN